MMSEIIEAADIGKLTPDEQILFRRVLEKHPKAWIDVEVRSNLLNRYFMVNGDGFYLCASPSAAATRAKGFRCCVGGPCNEPAGGFSAFDALARALVGTL